MEDFCLPDYDEGGSSDEQLSEMTSDFRNAALQVLRNQYPLKDLDDFREPVHVDETILLLSALGTMSEREIGEIILESEQAKGEKTFRWLDLAHQKK